MKARKKLHGRVIDRVRARQQWAIWRQAGRRVVELRANRRTASDRARSRFEIPVVFVGDESAQRAVIKRNRLVVRQP